MNMIVGDCYHIFTFTYKWHLEDLFEMQKQAHNRSRPICMCIRFEQNVDRTQWMLGEYIHRYHTNCIVSRLQALVMVWTGKNMSRRTYRCLYVTYLYVFANSHDDLNWFDIWNWRTSFFTDEQDFVENIKQWLSSTLSSREIYLKWKWCKKWNNISPFCPDK